MIVSLISYMSVRISRLNVLLPSITASLTIFAISVLDITFDVVVPGVLHRDSTVLAKAVISMNPNSLSCVLLGGANPSRLRGWSVNFT